MMKRSKFDEDRYFEVGRILDEKFPYECCRYENLIIASAFGYRVEDDLTEDKVRRQLLANIEDGFMTYSESLAMFPKYMEAIAELKKMF